MNSLVQEVRNLPSGMVKLGLEKKLRYMYNIF